MKRTLCTLAVGDPKFRIMALVMMQSAHQYARGTIDRFVVFTDELNWKAHPTWLELIQISRPSSRERTENWALKPHIFTHKAAERDLLLFIDADSTIHSDVFDKCFKWIQRSSLLLYLNELPVDGVWGSGLNLGQIYRDAGFDLRNISLNSGIIGRAPDALGKSFSTLFVQTMEQRLLKDSFQNPEYRNSDEPYAGLAYQLALKECGREMLAKAHPLQLTDYMLTFGAIPSHFNAQGGPVIKIKGTAIEVKRPGIVHWVTATQYRYYRLQLWKGIHALGFLRVYFVNLLLGDIEELTNRVRRRLTAVDKRFRVSTQPN